MAERSPIAGRRRGRAAAGFTLVELLVVISIVAILIALLLPGLGAAKGHAQSVSCKTRLHSLFIASENYRNDWRAWYPANNAWWEDGNSNAIASHVYVNQVRPYMNVNDPIMYVQYRADRNPFICPGLAYSGYPSYSTALNTPIRELMYISNGVRLTSYMQSGFFGYGRQAGGVTIVPSTWRVKKEVYGDTAKVPLTLEIHTTDGRVGYSNYTANIKYPHPGDSTNVLMTPGNVKGFPFSMNDHLTSGTVTFSTSKYSGL